MNKFFFEAVVNKNEAMEADTITKNGRSLKSQKSRVNFFIMAFFALLTVGVIFSGCKKDDDDKDTNNGYNFTPPTSWTKQTLAGGIEKFTGPVDGFANPSINIVTETFDGTLEQYTNANIAQLTALFSITLVSQDAFQTTSGISGKKVVYTFTLSGTGNRQIQYYLSPKGGSKIYAIITCGGLTSYGTKYDTQFETAAKSFSWK